MKWPEPVIKKPYKLRVEKYWSVGAGSGTHRLWLQEQGQGGIQVLGIVAIKVVRIIGGERREVSQTTVGVTKRAVEFFEVRQLYFPGAASQSCLWGELSPV